MKMFILFIFLIKGMLPSYNRHFLVFSSNQVFILWNVKIFTQNFFHLIDDFVAESFVDGYAGTVVKIFLSLFLARICRENFSVNNSD